jgi:hypothetical protein
LPGRWSDVSPVEDEEQRHDGERRREGGDGGPTSPVPGALTGRAADPFIAAVACQVPGAVSVDSEADQRARRSSTRWQAVLP